MRSKPNFPKSQNMLSYYLKMLVRFYPSWQLGTLTPQTRERREMNLEQNAMHWCLKNQSNQARYMFCKICLNFMEQYSFKVDRDNTGFVSMTSHYWYFHIQSLIVVIWTIKSHMKNLMFYFMHPMDVHWTSR